jgi:aromatic-L-amino-acid/L-tryptophan decarboxylase
LQINYQPSTGLPQSPGSYPELVKFVMEELAPLSQWPGHAGFAAYVAGSGNMVSNLAQLLSQTLNPFTGHYMMAPGLVMLEAEVIQWFIKAMDFRETNAGGFLTTGSSLAAMSALTMARAQMIRGYDFSRATMYVSDQSHHCLSKAWVNLGFDPNNIRFIATDRPTYQMNCEALNACLTQDLRENKIPMCIVASAGTTNTGAVDPLAQIADICEQHNIWLHIDGAYGALFKMTEKGSQLMSAVGRAQSLAFDLHKALGMSYGTGCLLVQNRDHMRFVYPGGKSYMPPENNNEFASEIKSEVAYECSNEASSYDSTERQMQSQTQSQTQTQSQKQSEKLSDTQREIEAWFKIDFADITPELSRDYRGLRVWLPLKTFGIEPFILNLEEKLKLAEWLYSQLSEIPQIEIMAPPQLSILAFAVNIGGSLAEKNANTQLLLEKINSRGTLFLSTCVLDERLSIRVCLLSFRLHFSRLETAITEIKRDLATMSLGQT